MTYSEHDDRVDLTLDYIARMNGPGCEVCGQPSITTWCDRCTYNDRGGRSRYATDEAI